MGHFGAAQDIPIADIRKIFRDSEGIGHFSYFTRMTGAAWEESSYFVEVTG